MVMEYFMAKKEMIWAMKMKEIQLIHRNECPFKVDCNINSIWLECQIFQLNLQTCLYNMEEVASSQVHWRFIHLQIYSHINQAVHARWKSQKNKVYKV